MASLKKTLLGTMFERFEINRLTITAIDKNLAYL